MISGQDYAALEEAVKLYKWSFTIEEMVDSGLMEIVPSSEAETPD